MANQVATDCSKPGNEHPTGIASGEENSGTDLWLLCKAGSHGFALPMTNVIETMRMLPIEAIASAPPLVCGLSIIRGAALPVIDTARLFDGEGGRSERLVTVRTGERIVAFAASAILGVQSIQTGRREELPPLLHDAGAIAAIARLDEELVFLLQAARALPDDFHVSGSTRPRDS